MSANNTSSPDANSMPAPHNPALPADVSSSSPSSSSSSSSPSPSSPPSLDGGKIKEVLSSFSPEEINSNVGRKMTSLLAELVATSEGHASDLMSLTEENKMLSEENKNLKSSAKNNESAQRQEVQVLGKEAFDGLELGDNFEKTSVMSAIKNLADRVPKEMLPELKVVFATSRAASANFNNQRSQILTENFRQNREEQKFRDDFYYLTSGGKRPGPSYSDGPNRRFHPYHQHDPSSYSTPAPLPPSPAPLTPSPGLAPFQWKEPVTKPSPTLETSPAQQCRKAAGDLQKSIFSNWDGTDPNYK